MRLHLHPEPKKRELLGSGIDVVVSEMYKHLPGAGVDLVGRNDSPEIYAAHITPPTAEPVDVLHCHGLYPTGSSEIENWAWQLNHRVIEAVRTAYVVTVPSPWVGELFARDMGFLPEVVPHGLDLSNGLWPLREKVPEIPTVLWNKNRDSDVCNPEPVVELAKKTPQIHFVSTFGVSSPNLRITGTMPHDQMRELLYESSIYFASTKETFGIGVLEAMVTGMPVLAWNWGNAPHLVEHKKTGYIVEPGDIVGSHEGLKYILDNYGELALGAREKALEYSWKAAIERYVEVYKMAQVRQETLSEGLVSVIIPCHNYMQYVGEAIRSIKAQIYSNFECIVVDDGSTDDSVARIEEAIEGDNRFRLVRKTNSGVAETRNLGAISANGAFLCFLDADDILLPEGLRYLVRGMRGKRSLGIGYGRLQVINDDGRVTSERSAWPGEYSVHAQMGHKNQVPSCCLIRKEAFMRAGGYKQHTAPAEDAELWTRIPLLGYDVALVSNRVVYQYRMHPKNATFAIRNGRKSEPDWLAWIPSAHRGHMPFASIVPSEKLSHPVLDYDRPLLSFVTPVGEDHKDLVRDAIESVAGQSNPAWELIVVDDTKAGNLPEHGKLPYKIAYPFVRWFRNEKRGNVSAARNIGAKNARGHYLCFLDADDYLLREFVDKMLEVAVNCKTDSAVIYSDWICMPEGKAHVAENWNLRKLLDHALFAVTFVHPKSAFDSIGGFDERLPLWEDWDYTIRLALMGYKGIRRPEPLFAYRYNTGKRREDSLRHKDALATIIQNKYQGARRKKKRPG